MIRKGQTRTDGFVLIDALVAVAILAVAGTVVYQGGIDLLQRSASDLDRTAALTGLHVEALLLQSRGQIASQLLPTEDELFRYRLIAPAKDEAPADTNRFHWSKLVATSKDTGEDIASLTVGFDR